MTTENLEDSISVTIVGNGVGAAAGAIASQIAAAYAKNPTLATGLALAKVSFVSTAAETLTVVIAIQSGDPNRIGSTSSAAIASIAASTIAGIGAAAIGAGAIATIVAVGVFGYLGTQLGKKIWAEWTEDDSMNNARDKFHNSKSTSSPIIIDLDGDGVETKAVNRGAHFDHDGNGYAESTGWVGKDDGLLVRDVDGSGYIDTGSELFGNNTKLSNGQKAANGFEALKDLDAVANGGNADGKIDSNDAAWASLKVWKDANGDGYHSDGEVISLTEAGVQSLNVAYTNSTHVDANGNAHNQLGSFTKTDGTSAQANDVWFAVDKMNTIAEDTQEVSSEIAAQPELRGFGNVSSLRQTMMMDTTGGLKGLVEKFSDATSRQQRYALMDSIIYKWTGAENVSSARGVV